MKKDSTYILCKKIFTQYKEGSKLLNENLLEKKYKVSRSSIREALKILKSKGVVKGKQKIGTYIASYKNLNYFDKDILNWSEGSSYSHEIRKHFIETRMMFEPEIAYYCAKRIDKKNKNELIIIYNNLSQSVKNKNSKDIIRYDLDFHKKIFSNCNNPLLLPLYGLITHILELNFKTLKKESKDYIINWKKTYLLQHKDLKDAIIKNHPLKAKQKMTLIIFTNKETFIL